MKDSLDLANERIDIMKQEIDGLNKKIAEMCPCARLTTAEDAAHMLGNECEKLMAERGDRRGMRRLYMKAYRADSAIGRIIAKFTFNRKSKICHVSTLIYSKQTDIGRIELFEIEATSRDNVHEHVHDKDARDGDYFYMDVTLEQFRHIVARAKSIVGCKYDRIGNLGFVTRTRIENPYKWFCSESQAWVFETDAPISRMPAYKHTPYGCSTSIAWTPCSKEEVV